MTYVKPADPEMFRMGKNELVAIAAGRGKRATAAQAEIERRRLNKATAKADAKRDVRFRVVA